MHSAAWQQNGILRLIQFLLPYFQFMVEDKMKKHYIVIHPGIILHAENMVTMMHIKKSASYNLNAALPTHYWYPHYPL